jgi:hypothetical protein
MLQKLKSLPVAIIVTVVVALLAALFGGRAALVKMRAEAWAAFSAIQYDLDEIAANANNLVTVAKRYTQEDALFEAIRESSEIMTAIQTPVMNSLNAEYVRKSVDELNALLIDLPLDDRDEAYRLEIMANIDSRYRTTQNSDYNRLAEEFNRALASQPARLIAKLTGVDGLQLFDYMLLQD